MSLAFRLLKIEAAIPYDDVAPSWPKIREDWSLAVFENRADPGKMAVHLIRLLKSLKPACIAYFWKDGAPSWKKMISKLEAIKGPDPKGAVPLKAIVTDFESRAVPAPPESERALMGSGRPVELELGDDGPTFEVGDKLNALDIRATWCNGEVVKRRVSQGGVFEYRVHYEGWSKGWNEWLSSDSGRVRLQRCDMPTKKGGSRCPLARQTRTPARASQLPTPPPPPIRAQGGHDRNASLAPLVRPQARAQTPHLERERGLGAGGKGGGLAIGGAGGQAAGEQRERGIFEPIRAEASQGAGAGRAGQGREDGGGRRRRRRQQRRRQQRCRRWQRQRGG